MAYVLLADSSVTSNASLVIGEGAVVKVILTSHWYGEGGYIGVDGTLTATGSAANPIIITSLKDDAYGGDTNNDGGCLLYTSDAADERSSVDLGGRRIIKKKKNIHTSRSNPDATTQEL